MLATLQLLLAVALVGAGLPAGAQTRTGGSNTGPEAFTGVSAAASPGSAWEIYDAAPELAADALLAAKGAGRGSEARGLKQPDNGTFFVDPKGNAIPTPPGGKITGSPDGRFIQARDAAGNPTGVRLDGPHNPKLHPDPRAQQPHGHVPGVTNPDGTPWLPVK